MRLEAVPMPMEKPLKIVIVDESPPRAAILEEGLREAGYTRVVRLGEIANLLAQVCAIDPDVILIGLEKPEPRDARRNVSGQPGGQTADRHVRRPER